MTTTGTQAPLAQRRRGRASRRGIVLAALLLFLACGKKGPPLPPEPRGPLPPTGVTARQVGEQVEVRFDVPPPPITDPGPPPPDFPFPDIGETGEVLAEPEKKRSKLVMGIMIAAIAYFGYRAMKKAS